MGGAGVSRDDHGCRGGGEGGRGRHAGCKGQKERSAVEAYIIGQRETRACPEVDTDYACNAPCSSEGTGRIFVCIAPPLGASRLANPLPTRHHELPSAYASWMVPEIHDFSSCVSQIDRHTLDSALADPDHIAIPDLALSRSTCGGTLWERCHAYLALDAGRCPSRA